MATPSNQLAQRESEKLRDIGGSFRSASQCNRRLAWAAESAHLIAPMTSVGDLQEGFALAFSIVHVDTRDMRDGGEIYSVGGNKWGLGKSVLDRIAAAAGISWDPVLSRRLDDGSNPYYVHFRAVGRVKSFDGEERFVSGEKEMDLRPGSPQIQALEARLTTGGTIDKQLRELRLHVLAHAESKARNRAIRSLGLKASYVKADLAKPFVATKLVWTGQSDDPELKRIFAVAGMEKALGARQALYGAEPVAPQLPRGDAPHAPPPVGRSVAVAEDIDLELDIHPRVVDAPPPSPRGSRTAGASGVVVPGKKGKYAGKPIEDADDKTLEWWCGTIGNKLEAGEVEERFRAKDAALVEAMRAELARRSGGAAPDADADCDPNTGELVPPDAGDAWEPA
jgi:hypothetical protein